MFRTLLAVVAGFVAGSATNIALIQLGSAVVPAPDGMDVTSTESVAAMAHLFEPKHFLFPFLAHAAGTFVGALIAAWVARERDGLAAGVIGGLNLMGGIAAASMIPAPLWFVAVDLIFAYLPMAWLALKLRRRLA